MRTRSRKKLSLLILVLSVSLMDRPSAAAAQADDAVESPGQNEPTEPTETGTGTESVDPLLEQRLSRLESLMSQPRPVAPGTRYKVPAPEPAVYAGAELLFVKPQMKESFEATILNTVPPGQNTLVPLSYDFNVTPRAWLGFRNSEGVGLRATYWGFDHNGNGQTLVSDGVNLPGATATTVIYPAAIIAPIPGSVLQTASSLNVQTFDLEGTAELNVNQLNVTLGGGLRYATTDQQMAAQASLGGLPFATLDWSRKFEGFGPTVSGTVTRPICGGLSAFGNFRGSLLFGEKDLNRSVFGDITPPPVAGPPVVGLNGADEVVASGDLGIGLRYTVELDGSSEVFVQGSYEGQLWTEAGAPTLTFLGFQGLGLSLGYQY